jgi:hypothetical protein
VGCPLGTAWVLPICVAGSLGFLLQAKQQHQGSDIVWCAISAVCDGMTWFNDVYAMGLDMLSEGPSSVVDSSGVCVCCGRLIASQASEHAVSADEQYHNELLCVLYCICLVADGLLWNVKGTNADVRCLSPFWPWQHARAPWLVA